MNIQKCMCGKSTTRESGICRMCFIEQNQITDDEVKNYSLNTLIEEINEIAKCNIQNFEEFRGKIKRNPELFQQKVVSDALCYQFYYKDCGGCPFQKFENLKLSGCKRWFKLNVGDYSGPDSFKMRCKLFNVKE